MNECRCDCSHHRPLVLKYDDTIVEGQCRKCKKKHVLGLIDGKIQKIPDELLKATRQHARSDSNAKKEEPQRRGKSCAGQETGG